MENKNIKLERKTIGPESKLYVVVRHNFDKKQSALR